MKKIKLPGANKEVQMRGPKVKDMKAVSRDLNETEQEVELISNLTGLPVDEIDELSLKDYAELTTGLKTFL